MAGNRSHIEDAKSAGITLRHIQEGLSIEILKLEDLVAPTKEEIRVFGDFNYVFADLYKKTENPETILDQEQEFKLAALLVKTQQENLFDFTNSVIGTQLHYLRNLFPKDKLLALHALHKEGKLFKGDDVDINNLNLYKKSPTVSEVKREIQQANLLSAEVKGEIHRVNLSPEQVQYEDLTPEGELRMTDNEETEAKDRVNIFKFAIRRIDDLVARGRLSGRITKTEIQEAAAKGHPKISGKPIRSLEYHYDAETRQKKLWIIYKGKKYHLELGAGSFGTVKVVQEVELKQEKATRWGALKILAPDPDEKEPNEEEKKQSAIKEFIAAQALADAKSDFLVLGRESPTKKWKQHEIVMGLAHGEELDDVLGQPNDSIEHEAPKKSRYYFKIVDSFLEALLKFHESGYVHRDIKPRNLKLYGTKVQILDTGVSHNPTKEGEIADLIGTRGYYDYHSIVGRGKMKVSKAVDVYSAGIVIAEILGLGKVRIIKKKEKNGEMTEEPCFELFKENSVEFQTNNRVPEFCRQECLNIIRKMLREKNRTNIESAKIELQGILNRFRTDDPNYVRPRVCLINVNECFTLSNKIDMKKFTPLLLRENFDEVVLVEFDKQYSERDLDEIFKQLATLKIKEPINKRIRVQGDRVIRLSGKMGEKDFPSLKAQLESLKVDLGFGIENPSFTYISAEPLSVAEKQKFKETDIRVAQPSICFIDMDEAIKHPKKIKYRLAKESYDMIVLLDNKAQEDEPEDGSEEKSKEKDRKQQALCNLKELHIKTTDLTALAGTCDPENLADCKEQLSTNTKKLFANATFTYVTAKQLSHEERTAYRKADISINAPLPNASLADKKKSTHSTIARTLSNTTSSSDKKSERKTSAAPEPKKEFKAEIRHIEALPIQIDPNDVLPDGRLKLTEKPEHDAQAREIIKNKIQGFMECLHNLRKKTKGNELKVAYSHRFKKSDLVHLDLKEFVLRNFTLIENFYRYAIEALQLKDFDFDMLAYEVFGEEEFKKKKNFSFKDVIKVAQKYAEKKNNMDVVDTCIQHLTKKNFSFREIIKIINEHPIAPHVKKAYVDAIREIEAIEKKNKLREKPLCGVIARFNVNESNPKGKLTLWWKYKGLGIKGNEKESKYKEACNKLGIEVTKAAEHGHTLGSGAYAKAVIIQRERDKKYGVIRISTKDESKEQVDAAYTAGKTLPVATTQFEIVRTFSPELTVKNEEKNNNTQQRPFQRETIMLKAPGQELRSFLNERKEKKENFSPAHKQPGFKWFNFKVILNLFDAIIQLHDQSYLHRDIKPENLILWDTLLAAVDPGFAHKFEPDEISVTKAVGTPRYINPHHVFHNYDERNQLTERMAKNSRALDTHSLAVVIIEILGVNIDELGKKNEPIVQILKTMMSKSAPEDLRVCRKVFSDYYKKDILPHAKLDIWVVNIAEVVKTHKTGEFIVNKDFIKAIAKKGNKVFLTEFGIKHDEKTIALVMQEFAKFQTDINCVISLEKRDLPAVKEKVDEEINKTLPEIKERNYIFVSNKNPLWENTGGFKTQSLDDVNLSVRNDEARAIEAQARMASSVKKSR